MEGEESGRRVRTSVGPERTYIGLVSDRRRRRRAGDAGHTSAPPGWGPVGSERVGDVASGKVDASGVRGPDAGDRLDGPGGAVVFAGEPG